LSDTQIDDVSIPLLPKTLTALNLVDAEISEDGLRHLEEFHALIQIRLGGNSFTDSAVPHLERVPSLGRVILKDTRISDVAIEPLKKRGIFIEREK
jgi:hypothetical protein